MLRVGIIGMGSISKQHMNGYMQHENVDIVALCDINEERLIEKGAHYGITQLYTDYLDLLKNENIDAVSICTWNDSHARIAIDALEANKHVLVEKPLTITVEEACLVEVAAQKTDKVIQVGFLRRHSTNVHFLKQLIDDGVLGDIYYAKAGFLRVLGNPGGWFSDRTRSGGGPLIDLGVHMIDLCWYLMGRPRPVSVTGNTYHKLGNRSHLKNDTAYKAADSTSELNDVEDLTNALIRFENGASLMIEASFTLQARKNDRYVKIYGDKGGAEVEPELAIVTEKNNTILNIEPQVDYLGLDFKKTFINEINHFVSSCLEGTPSIAPVQDGVEIMKILQAIYESAEKGKEVYL